MRQAQDPGKVSTVVVKGEILNISVTAIPLE
jgi:hypothetical protein